MMNYVRLPFLPSLVIAITLFTGCAKQHPVYEPGVAFYQKAIIDLARPSMQGRDAGTDGLVMARDYLLYHFERIGLQPAFGDTYQQPLEVRLGIHAQDQMLMVAAADESIAFQPGERYEALGLSGNGKFEGDAVFLGYGTDNEEKGYDSYADVSREDIAGKVVIAYRYEPMDDSNVSLWTKKAGQWSRSAGFLRKAQLAQEHGATALIVVNPPWMADEESKELRDAASTTTARGVNIPVYHSKAATLRTILESARMDVPVTLAIWQRKANERDHTAIPIPGVKLRGLVKLADEMVQVQNVAGIVPGRGDLAGETIIIGAHYDHIGFGVRGSRTGDRDTIHPGADDNASGTAATLLLAQRIHDLYTADKESKSLRTVVFVLFTAEERGLIGSRFLARDLSALTVDAGKITCMINMDMVGRVQENKLNIMGLGNGDQWKKYIDAANARIKFDLSLHDQAMPNSDHASFTAKEIPAIHFFSGFHPDYHSPTDTYDKINHKDAVRVVKFIDLMLADMVRERPAMAWVKKEGPAPDPHKEAVAQGDDAPESDPDRVRFGILPAYDGAPGEGARVEQVFAGTPAAKAGLQDGDIIIGWNDDTVDDVKAFTDLLYAGTPGDKVDVKVKRGEEELVLPVELERRGG